MSTTANPIEAAAASIAKPISARMIARLRAANSPTGCTRPDSLFGLWSIEPKQFTDMVATAKSVDLLKLAESRKSKADGTPSGPVPTLSPEPGKKKAGSEEDYDMSVEDDEDENRVLPDDDDPDYDVVNGIAVFAINGPMTKYQTSFQDIFGGTATVPLRKALRQAAMDPEVTCAILCIESPGGTVAGMTDLASDIRALNAEKPCYAYIQDMGASAAYWAASQCSKIYANANAVVGCIGTMAVLQDTSRAYEQQGIKVLVVTSDVPDGDTMKGAGVDGTAITDDQLADCKRQINEQNDLFVADVATGRSMTPDRVRGLADGRVHVGAKAQALGLVDEISSFDAAMQAIFTENYSMNSESFRAFASANPEDPTVKSLIATGHKAGKADGHSEARGQMASMLAAFPGREKFAAEQFAKGHDAVTAKADLADVQADEIKALQAKLAEQAQVAARRADDNPAIALPLPGTAVVGKKEEPADPAANPAAAIAAFEDAWKVHQKGGMSADRAVAKVVKEQPELHNAYIEAIRATQPARRR